MKKKVKLECFSVFDELIQDQGEAAFIIEGNEKDWKFVGYINPKREKMFEEGEIRNAFPSQTVTDKKFEDSERELLTGYLKNNTWNMATNEQKLANGEGQRSVYRYMPVDLKVKPVIQELPSKFRNVREIKGDPLA